MYTNVFGLDNATIKSVAPSVFAPSAHQDLSSKYAFISTGDILEKLREVGFAPTGVMQSVARNKDKQDFTKHLLRLRRVDDLGKGKPDVYEVVLVNSCDGSSSYQLFRGIFRMVCTNGCITGQIDDKFRVRHTGNVVTEVVESTLATAGEADRVMDAVAEMKAIDLPKSERELFADYALRARFMDSDEDAQTKALTIYKPADFLQPMRREDTATDLYTTYQVVQEHTVRGARGRERGRSRRTGEIKGIDQNVKLNQLVWQFAEELRKLHS